MDEELIVAVMLMDGEYHEKAEDSEVETLDEDFDGDDYTACSWCK